MSSIASTTFFPMNSTHARRTIPGSTGSRVIPVRELSGWQIEALRKLADFEKLHPNWDSYGSPRISDGVIDMAVELVRNANFDNVPAPRIIPISGGGIQFEWGKGAREIELEIHPDLSIEALIEDADEQIPNNEFVLANPNIEKLLSWLDAG